MIAQEKKRLRAEIRAMMWALAAGDAASMSAEAMTALESNARFRRAAVVGLFWSLPDEPSTHSFVEKWSAHKVILLPYIEDGNMVFRQYTPQCEIRPGCYGIGEPPLSDKIFSADQMDMIVVPGIAFDRDGHRLGRGKGYYDRFLAGALVYKAGVCFPFQLSEDVPYEQHDVVMDEVITI